jgi:hypothetical protein
VFGKPHSLSLLEREEREREKSGWKNVMKLIV